MAKFFEQLGGAPAVAAFTNGDWTDYVEGCFEEAGKGKGKERMECQEIGLVAFMFFFELFFLYVSSSISFYVSLTYSLSFLSLSADHPRHSRRRRSKISILLIQETV